MKYSKVSGYDNLIRDNNTGAIINIDKTILNDVDRIRKNNHNMKNLYSDVQDLKNEISDIKNLLTELIKCQSPKS
jgi:uncharacterized coiled-coil DUF342 family protein